LNSTSCLRSGHFSMSPVSKTSEVMRILDVAPGVALFAVLIVVAMIPSQGALGHTVQVAQAATEGACGDSRITVAYVIDDRHVNLSSETLGIEELAAHLREIYATKAERVLFLKAAHNVPFQSVAEVIGIAKQQIGVVAILTPSIEGQPCWVVHTPSPDEWISTGRRPPAYR
jgi:biopolymer transport protein ExbD